MLVRANMKDSAGFLTHTSEFFQPARSLYLPVSLPPDMRENHKLPAPSPHVAEIPPSITFPTPFIATIHI